MSPRVLRNLDELYAGVCDGMTYAEIEEMYPEEYKMRKEDKLGYRYPRGESYLDVISRLDPLVHELESYSEPVLIVGHQAVLRLIYAYFVGTFNLCYSCLCYHVFSPRAVCVPNDFHRESEVFWIRINTYMTYGVLFRTGKQRDQCPRLSIPLNTIIKLTPRTHDCAEERFVLDISVDGKHPQVLESGEEPPSH